jgi:Fe-S-cluster-containing dehydrogenase component
MTEKPSRRGMIKALGVTLGGCAFAGALSPLLGFAEGLTVDEVLQKHYHELSRDELQAILARLEADARERHGVEVAIRDDPPIEGVQFAYALNLSVCIGCRRCVEACHQENNHDRRTRNSYIRVYEMRQGSLDLEGANVTYTHPVPAEGRSYMPIQCQQCANPPCVRACPTRATWQEPDGIVVVDANWCIGCRYCQAACPYHARRFNWRAPEVPAEEINTDQGYLSNRLRQQGVVEKCTFCLHRVRRGRHPACLESCPTGARVFGDVMDERSEIRWVLDEKRVFVLKEQLGTRPRFFYYFDK